MPSLWRMMMETAIRKYFEILFPFLLPFPAEASIMNG